MRLYNLLKDVEVRYSEPIYFHYNASPFQHFWLGYLRILKNLVKHSLYLLKPVRCHVHNGQLAIYETEMQRRALVKLGCNARQVTHTGRWWPRNILHLMANGGFLFLYPFLFIVLYPYRRSLVAQLSAIIDYFIVMIILKWQNVSTLIVANDHAGFPFIFSRMIAINCAPIRVKFVAHAPAKAAFPKNHFDEVFVFEKREADIYEQLCLNENAVIKQINDAICEQEYTVENDLLLSLSHPFPLKNILKIRIGFTGTLALRFHPSDKIKAILLSPFLRLMNIKIDDSETFEIALSRSKKCFSAMSSSLKTLPDDRIYDVLCIMSLGRNWVYYDDLNPELKIMASPTEALEELKK